MEAPSPLPRKGVSRTFAASNSRSRLIGDYATESATELRRSLDAGGEAEPRCLAIMWDDEDLIAAYRRLCTWVERERRRRGDTQPDQQWLRRSRLCADVPPLTLKELLRELQAFKEIEES